MGVKMSNKGVVKRHVCGGIVLIVDYRRPQGNGNLCFLLFLCP